MFFLALTMFLYLLDYGFLLDLLELPQQHETDYNVGRDDIQIPEEIRE